MKARERRYGPSRLRINDDDDDVPRRKPVDKGGSSTLQPLQRVQNAAARLVFGLSRSDHVMLTLIQLQILPVSYRIKFKLCCLVHAIHYGRSPAYLTETVQSAVSYTHLTLPTKRIV